MPAISSEPARVGKKGVLVIPARMRERFGLKEGTLVVTEETDNGILVRPAVALSVEVYTSERQAAFLLSNAMDGAEYQDARSEVVAMGLNPDNIPHSHPTF